MKILNLLTDSLHERYQRAVVNEETSSWELVRLPALWISVFSYLQFLIYISHLPHRIYLKDLFANIPCYLCF